MDSSNIEKIDFLVKTDGFLRDYILSVVIASIIKDLKEEVKYQNVNKNHLHSALILKRLSPCSLKTFATTLHLSKSSASALINRMVQENIVERKTNPENRREILLTLTPAFNEHIQKIDGQLIDWFVELINEIGEESFEKWHEVMTKVNQTLMKRIKQNERI